MANMKRTSLNTLSCQSEWTVDCNTGGVFDPDPVREDAAIAKCLEATT